MATASGQVSGGNESFDCGITLVIAERFGIRHTLLLAIIAMTPGVFVGLSPREAVPAVLRRHSGPDLHVLHGT